MGHMVQRTFGLVSLSALIAAHGQPASAQSSDGQPEGDEAGPNIVVTARKREERIQDIPQTVSVLTGEQIEELGGVRNARDLVQLTPGVTFIDAATGAVAEPNIRGAGQARNPNADAAIGLYRDGAYISGGNLGGRTFQRFDLFDVERVEVLRGPQGALYGRNAVGGAINVISRRPEFDFGGYVEATYGSFETSEVRGALNLPINDKIALRVGGEIANQDGCMYRRSDNGSCFDFLDYHAGRLSALFEPTDRLEIMLVADYVKSEADAGATLFYTDAVNFVRPTDITTVQIDGSNLFETERANFSLNARQDFGWGELVAIVNHRIGDSTLLSDPNGIAVPTTEADRRVDDTAATFAEIRLQGDAEKLRWLVGADLFHLSNEYLIEIRGRALLGMAMINPNNDITTINEQRSYAAFASLEYDVTDRLTLSGEARYSTDRKDGEVVAVTVTGTPRFPDFPPGSPQANPVIEADNFAWGLTASYDATEDVMAFVRAATAFRAGGFNFEFGNPCDQPGEVPGTTCNLIDPPLTYEPETSITYEAGLKTQWLDDRLTFNVNAYYIEYSDLLANVNNGIMAMVDPLNAAMFLANAGDATAYGVEVELSWASDLPGDLGKIRIDVTGGHQSGEFEDVPAFLTTVADGNKIARLRSFSGLVNAVHTLRVSEKFSLVSSVTFRAEDGGFTGAENDFALDNLETLGARIALRSDRWSFAIAGQNLTNQRYLINQTASNFRIADARRIFGFVTFRW